LEIKSTPSNRPFLGCEDVTVQFYDRNTPVLKEINLTIEKNESVLLLGPSGCGKSTLCQVLSGIIPRSVEAIMRGKVWRPDRVGVLFQDPDTQFCMMNVEDEVAFSLENIQADPSHMRERVCCLAEQVGLHVPLSHSISSLSGGMKQRLALAAVLAQDPDVLFFDEPTAQLDPQGTNEILQQIQNLRETKTLVMIEHKLDGVIEWMDRVILFTPDGLIIDQGEPEFIFRYYQKEIKEYGIWTPRLWPLSWEQIEKNKDHPVYQRAVEVQERINENKRGFSISSKSTDPVLRTVGASLGFNDTEPVWSNVDVEIGKGEWVAVMGANGTGKSSFLKSLIGLHPLLKGQIELLGKVLGSYSSKELSERIGFVFQNPEHQFISDTVYDEVAFGGRLAGWSEERIREEAERLLKDFHLEQWRDANPFTLSQGQKRRLSVAGILLKRQPILMLDEPTFGQDAVTSAELMNRIRRHNEEGTTILMATHDVELVQEHAHRVLIFGEGKLLFDGSAEDLFTDIPLMKRARLTEPVSFELVRRLQSKGEVSGYKGIYHVY
jgi:energy-coupling factor transporter ATP-binding protein EcfA2